MMRDAMLKKLDDLMATLPDGWCRTHEEWAAIRAEIVSERCDACRWWRGAAELGHHVQRCAYIDTHMYPDACCSHFEKKDPA